MPDPIEMPKAYDPHSVEERLYEWWEERGYFQPVVDFTKKPFVISIPPPNVTGELHHGSRTGRTPRDRPGPSRGVVRARATNMRGNGAATGLGSARDRSPHSGSTRLTSRATHTGRGGAASRHRAAQNDENDTQHGAIRHVRHLLIVSAHSYMAPGRTRRRSPSGAEHAL